MEFLKNLYGDDIFNTILLAVFEFLIYLLAGLMGSATREILLEKNKKISRVIGSSLLAAGVLFVTSSWLQEKISNLRLIFGIGALIGFYIPNFLTSIKSGKIVKFIIKIVAPKVYDAMVETEKEEQEAKKKDSNNPS